MKDILVRKLVFSAILSAAALVSFLIESLFPPLFIPGARLGISNVFVLFAVIYIGVKEGFAVLIIKILLGSLFTGNISAALYSLPVQTHGFLIRTLIYGSCILRKRLPAGMEQQRPRIILCIQNTRGYEFRLPAPHKLREGILSRFQFLFCHAFQSKTASMAAIATSHSFSSGSLVTSFCRARPGFTS